MKRSFLLFLMLIFGGFAFANYPPPVQTVFIIVMENHNWSDVKGNPDAPYLNQTLLPMASYCEQYYNPPTNHPSLANYLWLEAGTNFGISENDNPSIHHQATTNHLVSQLQRAGISWKAYQEDIDGISVPLANSSGYAVRHDPFAYFDDITGTNNAQWPYGISHIRPYSELSADLMNNTVAHYNFITPDLCHDGHDLCEPFDNRLQQMDAWLATEIPRILNSSVYAHNGVVFITWDEGEGGDGPIGLIVLSPFARGGGYSNNLHYTHSSLLRTVQEIFGVGPLLNDAANANNLADLFTPFSITKATLLTNGFQMTFAGATPDRTNIVEASADLLTWLPVQTNVSGFGDMTIKDSTATNSTQRYYRVRELP